MNERDPALEPFDALIGTWGTETPTRRSTPSWPAPSRSSEWEGRRYLLGAQQRARAVPRLALGHRRPRGRRGPGHGGLRLERRAPGPKRLARRSRPSYSRLATATSTCSKRSWAAPATRPARSLMPAGSRRRSGPACVRIRRGVREDHRRRAGWPCLVRRADTARRYGFGREGNGRRRPTGPQARDRCVGQSGAEGSVPQSSPGAGISLVRARHRLDPPLQALCPDRRTTVEA
jgi:hypothetical protein